MTEVLYIIVKINVIKTKTLRLEIIVFMIHVIT